MHVLAPHVATGASVDSVGQRELLGLAVVVQRDAGAHDLAGVGQVAVQPAPKDAKASHQHAETALDDNAAGRQVEVEVVLVVRELLPRIRRADLLGRAGGCTKRHESSLGGAPVLVTIWG